MLVAVVGATGLVGAKMLRVLEERNFPVTQLLPVASERSWGKKVSFRGKEWTVMSADEAIARKPALALFSAGGAASGELAPRFAAAGCRVVDNSSFWRMDPEVPLVVPEINGADIFDHKGVIANPNCSTIITMMAVGGICRLSPIVSMNACTYQAVSGAGQGGLSELEEQTLALVRGESVRAKVFPAPIARNVIPHIGERLDNGYTAEEMKMQNEGRRILHLPKLAVTCTCVRVPVMRSHSISVTVRTRDEISVKAAEAAIRAFPGCALAEDLNGRDYPTPLDVSGGDTVWVGRVRKDLTDPRGITLWCCGDQLRKGAAANAVQILRECQAAR